jgi:hypothetical protein
MRFRLSAGLLLAAGGLLAALAPARATPTATPLPAPPAPAPAAPALEAAPRLPANTVVELEMVDSVSSETSRRGDLFKMRVAVAVSWQGQVLVPAGTLAVGQVVHVQKARGGGKGGELILAARYLDLPQGQVKLRSTFGAAGANRVRTSLALAYAVGPFAMLVKGKTVAMPAGAALSARIAEPPLSSPPDVGGAIPATSE